MANIRTLIKALKHYIIIGYIYLLSIQRNTPLDYNDGIFSKLNYDVYYIALSISSIRSYMWPVGIVRGANQKRFTVWGPVYCDQFESLPISYNVGLF